MKEKEFPEGPCSGVTDTCTEDGNGTTRWLCTKKGQIPEETLPEGIQQMHQSKKMIDLNELRYFGKYGINYNIDELIADGRGCRGRRS